MAPGSGLRDEMREVRGATCEVQLASPKHGPNARAKAGSWCVVQSACGAADR